MKALKMPIRYCSSCYKEKSIQVSYFTYSTLVFLVLKTCLMQMLYYFFFLLCKPINVCVLSKCTVQRSPSLSPLNRP